MNRTKAREYAFILLFEYRFQPNEIEQILEDFINEYEPGAQQSYIEDVVRGVVSDISEIDQKIESAVNGWQIETMSCVSVAVLRLAVYEITKRSDIPNPVTLNEAVALAKKYDGEEAAPFVNGILGAICKA